jgi:thioredoxin-related protein
LASLLLTPTTRKFILNLGQVKKLLLFNLLLALSLALSAQNWQTDFATAKSIAEKENKPIVLVFSGSDWCAPCMKLEKEIWSSEVFKTYAQEHYVLLKADFPKRKQNALTAQQQEHNNKLAEQYNKNGYFPYVIVMDAKGNIQGATGYKGMPPEEYIAHLNSLKK